MSTSVTINGVSYTVPAIADASWGTNVSNYLIAIASGCLQKTGGAFTLSAADVDFGGTYGLKALYFKTKTANLSSAGILRLAVADSVGWRNNANSGDLLLAVNGSNQLTFNGAVINVVGTLITPSQGGTGVANNNASTITISGSYATTITLSNTTSITLPTSGTLYGTATGSITSAQLLASLTDETGTGVNVFNDTPTLIAPLLGTPTSGNLSNCLSLPIVAGTTGTLSVARGGTGLTSGTSGGVLAYTASGTLASSGALTASQLISRSWVAIPIIGDGSS